MNISNINHKLQTLRDIFVGLFGWCFLFCFVCFCNLSVYFLSVSFGDNIISQCYRLVMPGSTSLSHSVLLFYSPKPAKPTNCGWNFGNNEPKSIISPFKLFVPSIFRRWWKTDPIMVLMMKVSLLPSCQWSLHLLSGVLLVVLDRIVCPASRTFN